MIVATALAFLYSLPPIQLKKYFITKTIVSAVGSLLTSLLGATAAGYYPEILIPLLILSFLSAWTLSTLADVHDMEGDFKAGRRTIPIVMGFHHTLFLIYFFIILSTLIAVGGIILFAQANIIGISIAVAAGGYMLYRTIRISYDPSLKTYMKNPVNDLVQVLLQLSLLISILIRS
jgi:4-hydroxybenzoate polyprenyltransferase